MVDFLSKIDWSGILTALGGTAIIATAITFISKVAIEHFFRRDLETYKADLKRTVVAQKGDFDRQAETFRTELAHADRVRQEVVRWANPILGSVVDLQHRLGTILNNYGYLALSPDYKYQVNPGWPIDYEWFLQSTVYLFCQYFCWVRLLEEKLSFELFEKHDVKDSFFANVRAVRRYLGTFPLLELKDLTESGDRQVFSLQQRALGEALFVPDGNELRCMRFSEFLEKWAEPAFKGLFNPLSRFIGELTPENTLRWKRLELMAQALEELRLECVRLLTIKD